MDAADVKVGQRYNAIDYAARWGSVTVTRIWTADDGHRGVAFTIHGPRTSFSAMPLARFAEGYAPRA